MAKATSFEEAINALETCVERLEQDDLPIDEALKHFESGVKNIQKCQKALEGARLKIEQLTSDQDQQLTTKPLDL